jgi:o-succinylbenzoate synthase
LDVSFLSDSLISQMDIFPIRIPRKAPFRISLGTVYDFEAVLVRVQLSNGVAGWGEAAPFLTITGDTARTALTILEHEIKPRIVGSDLMVFEDTMRELDRSVPGNTSAKAGVDIAIHDALARNAGMPLNGFLGRRATELETTQTVGLENREETVKQARSLRGDDVTRIKLKIGGDPNEDAERIRAVREDLGMDFALTVDANQGYSVRQAIQVLKRLEKYEVDFCEQPIHWRDIDGLAEVRKNSPIAIMADESVHSPRDALEVIQKRAADMINIKLMKSGGIRSARKIAAIAEAAGIPCMVGCMVETKIGVTAGCHFATASPIVKYADLDGHTDLKIDPVRGGIDLKGSKETLMEGLGLALDVDMSVLQNLAL